MLKSYGPVSAQKGAPYLWAFQECLCVHESEWKFLGPWARPDSRGGREHEFPNIKDLKWSLWTMLHEDSSTVVYLFQFIPFCSFPSALFVKPSTRHCTLFYAKTSMQMYVNCTSPALTRWWLRIPPNSWGASSYPQPSYIPFCLPGCS